MLSTECHSSFFYVLCVSAFLCFFSVYVFYPSVISLVYAYACVFAVFSFII